MRTIVKRFAALAFTLAMAFGMVSAVNAQTGGTVTVSSTTGGFIQVSLADNNVPFGTLDAFGLGSYSNATPCHNLDQATNTTYAANTSTKATVISTTAYDVTVTNVDPSYADDFVIFLGGSCLSPISFQNANGETVGVSPTATDRDGDLKEVFLGAIIRTNEAGNSSTSLTFNLTVGATDPT